MWIGVSDRYYPVISFYGLDGTDTGFQDDYTHVCDDITDIEYSFRIESETGREITKEPIRYIDGWEGKPYLKIEGKDE